MRKLFFTALLLVMILSAYAQQDITKFMGIPVDGSKSEMIKKLEKKGFKYDYRNDYLTGEFNGYDVTVHVVTNNNKVYRIAIFDEKWCNETDIKIRFNNLCTQFEKTGRYVPLDWYKDQHLTDDDDISYIMRVENKRIEAAYCQINSKEDLFKEVMDYQIDIPKQVTDTVGLFTDVLMGFWEQLSKRTVWFMIDEKYGKYQILMFYDNAYNKANGDEL